MPRGALHFTDHAPVFRTLHVGITDPLLLNFPCRQEGALQPAGVPRAEAAELAAQVAHLERQVRTSRYFGQLCPTGVLASSVHAQPRLRSTGVGEEGVDFLALSACRMQMLSAAAHREHHDCCSPSHAQNISKDDIHSGSCATRSWRSGRMRCSS